MTEIRVGADELYNLSKKAFYALIPECEISGAVGHAQFAFKMRTVASESKTKTDRRTLTAYALIGGSESDIAGFTQWLTTYFSESMQHEAFELHVRPDGIIVPDFVLEKALNKVKTINRKR